MTTRTIHGLQWRAISPSFYELVGTPEIDLSFVGDIWYLTLVDEQGEPRMQPFASRDAAAAMVAYAITGDINLGSKFLFFDVD